MCISQFRSDFEFCVDSRNFIEDILLIIKENFQGARMITNEIATKPTVGVCLEEQLI